MGVICFITVSEYLNTNVELYHIPENTICDINEI